MFTQEEIAAIITDLFRKEKNKHAYTELYDEALKMFVRLQTHFDGSFPPDLFKERAPNESPKEFEYRKSIWKPITKPYIGRFVAATNRIWNERNYSVAWGEEEHEQYFDEQFPLHRSIFSYFQQVVMRQKFKDPNGFIAPWVESMPAPNELTDVMLVIWETPQVRAYESQKYLLAERQEKSWIKKRGKMVREGRQFVFYDDTNIWMVIQLRWDAEDNAGQYEFTPFFDTGEGHGLQRFPVWQLRGKPIKFIEGQILWESYMADALPSLECALIDHSTLQMSKYAHAFPVKVEYVDPCPEPQCISGKIIRDIDGKQSYVDCPRCAGHGTKTGSPLGTYQVLMTDAQGRGKTNFPTNPLQFVSPDPTILEFTRKEIKEAIHEAFALLNIDVSNELARGSETALGKQIDREELFAFLLTLTTECFDLAQNSIEALGQIRYGKEFKAPVITPPTTFKLREDRELMEEISHPDVPDHIKRAQLAELHDVRFSSDSVTQARFRLIRIADKFLTKTDEQVRMMMASGSVDPVEFNIHCFISNYIELELLEDANFFAKTITEQMSLIRARASADVFTRGGVEEILRLANGGT